MLAYILVAIFLLGILTMSVTQGPKKSARTQQIDELFLVLMNDLETLESAVQECVLMYQSPVDIDADGDKDAVDNPNPPFPKIYTTVGGYADTGALADAVCPGAPPTPLTTPAPAAMSQKIISVRAGRQVRYLTGNSRYTTTYTSNTTEGVYIKVTGAAAVSLWPEVAARLNAALTTCRAAVVTGASTDFYFWIKRLPTSVLGPEAGCP